MGTLLLSIRAYVFGFGLMHRREAVHPYEAASVVWLEYVNGRTGRLFHKDTQREIFVPVNELEADKLLRQTPGAAILGIDVKLVGNHRGEMGGREEREKGLPKLGLLLLGSKGTKVNIGIEEILHR